MMRPPRSVAASCVLALAASGCAGPIVTSPAPSETPLTSDAATVSPEPDPAATELTVGPLPAGRYTQAGFEPAITLEVDGSWEAVQLHPGFFDVQRDPGSPDVIAVQFARPSLIAGAAAGGDAVSSAAGAVAALGANPDLSVLETSESLMDGLVGAQVTVENAGDAHAVVMTVPPGDLGIDPGRRLWIAFFDTPDGLVALMVGGSAARWDEALTAAEPVLESVTLGR